MNALIQFFPRPPTATPEAKKKYYEYLKSHQWELKRNAVFQREKGICQGCCEWSIENTHHLTYAHLFDELLFELVGLCENCHRKVHFIAEDRREIEY